MNNLPKQQLIDSVGWPVVPTVDLGVLGWEQAAVTQVQSGLSLRLEIIISNKGVPFWVSWVLLQALWTVLAELLLIRRDIHKQNTDVNSSI